MSSSPRPSLDARLLDRYLAHEVLTDTERTQVDAALGRSTALRMAVGEVQRTVREPVVIRDRAPDLARGRALLEQRTKAGRPQSIGARSIRRSSMFSMTRVGTALAGLAAIAVLAVVGVRHIETSGTTVPAEYREFRTGAGQRAEFRLPDGSAVTLGPESQIRYRADFGREEREAELSGQALFTVIHHEGHPFIVRTARGRATVLGTSFVVRAYAQDSAMRVVVAQGRVAVSKTVLGSGDLGVTRDGIRVDIAHAVNIAPELAWTEGMLVLNGISLRDAVPELERWYGMRIVVADPALWSDSVMTTLSTEGSRQALTFLADALGARVRFDGNTATLSAP